MPQQVVEAMAYVSGHVEPEQASGCRIEPKDFAVRVEDDATIREGAGALANRAQQPMIFFLAVARLGPELVDAGEDLGPQPARREKRHAPLTLERAIEQVQVTQHERDVEDRGAAEPPAGTA